MKMNKEIAALDSNGYSKTIPDDYLKLFKQPDRITFDSCTTSKHRFPIAELHNKDYYITIYKFNTSENFSLGNVKCNYENTNSISYYDYYANASTDKNLQIQYNLHTERNVSSIYFSLFGDNTHLIKKNDTLIYYCSDFKNFSVKYSSLDKIDIYGKSNKFSAISTEIMFLEKKKNVYFILLMHKNAAMKQDTKALSFLINSRTSN